MTKAISIFWMLIICTLAVSAQAVQEPSIRFNETNHDFGKLVQGHPASYVFVFENVSKTPVQLKNVRASCGCTTPKWTNEPIAPGGKGEITVGYNAASIGKFTKSITVTYDSTKQPILLYINGEVIVPEAVEPTYNYAFTQGNLGFDVQVLDAQTVNTTESKLMEVHVKNIGPHKITFSGDFSARQKQLFTYKPQHYELIPGEKTTLRFTLEGPNSTKWGAFSDTLVLKTDDAAMPEKKIAVVGTLNKVWTAAELAEAPNIAFEMTEYNGGQVIECEKLTVTYKFTNTGKKPLEIESAKPSCGCTASEPKERVIQPGGSSEIVATFDSRGRLGKQSKTITVRSNDPDQGAIILRLECDVVADPFHAGNGSGASPLSGNK